MGNNPAKLQLKSKELQELLDTTHFTQDEIAALYSHFQKISSSKTEDGVIDRDEFQQALALKDRMFVDRIFQLFDENSDGVINFREFLCGLSVFCTKGTIEQKIQFSFRLYDVDRDGYISKQELYDMLKASLVERRMDLPETQMRSLVERTFAEADTNHDGKISFEEYKTMVERHPSILSNMTISTSALTEAAMLDTPAPAGGATAAAAARAPSPVPGHR